MTFEEFVPTVCTITVSADPAEDGTASLSAPEHDGEYWAGDEVTVNITPNDDKMVEAVEVNGTEISPQNGVYKFTVTEDSAVIVYFMVRQIDRAQLDALGGDIAFEGSRVDVFDSSRRPTTTFSILGIFDEKLNAVYNLVINESNGRVSLASLKTEITGMTGEYASYNGYVGNVAHYADGTTYFMPLGNENGELFTMDDIANPFKAILPNQIVYADKGVWKFEDMSVAAQVLSAITGFNDSIESATLIEGDDGQIETILFETATRAYSSSDPHTYKTTYTLNVSDKRIDPAWLGDYTETTASQQKLQTALETAAATTSYKAHYQSFPAAGSSSSPEEYDVIATNQAIYEDQSGGTNLYRREDGSANIFYLYNGAFSKGSLYWGGSTLYELSANFADFNVQLMEETEPNVYQLRMFDAMVLTTTGSGYESSGLLEDSAPLVPGISLHNEWNRSYQLTVRLDEQGVLQSIDLSTEYGDSYTITFSEWNTAELPFEIPEDAIPANVPVEMIGFWIDNEKKYTVTIRVDGSTSGLSYGTITQDDDGNYYMTGSSWHDGASHSLRYGFEMLENGCLQLSVSEDGGEPIIAELSHCSYSEIDFADYYAQSQNGDVYNVHISNKEFSVTVNGNKKVATNVTLEGTFENYVLLIEFEDGSEYLMLQNDTNYRTWALFLDYENSMDYVMLNRIDYDWSQYVGEYNGKDADGTIYKVEIQQQDGLNRIVITTTAPGKDASTVTVDDAMLLWYYDYSSDSSAARFMFEADGKQQMVVPFLDTFAAYNREDFDMPLFLAKKDAAMDWSDSPLLGKHYGILDGKNYELDVTADAVSVTIDGKAAEVTVLNYNILADFTLLVNGQLTTIARDDEEAEAINVIDVNGNLLCQLFDVLNITNPDLWHNWITDDGSILLVIDNEGVSANYSEVLGVTPASDGRYSFEWNGNTYTFGLAGDGTLSLTSDALTDDVTLVVAPGWSLFIGQYRGIYGAGEELTLDITASHIAFNGALDMEFTENDDIMVAAVGVPISWNENEYYFLLQVYMGGTYYRLQTPRYNEEKYSSLTRIDTLCLIESTYMDSRMTLIEPVLTALTVNEYQGESNLDSLRGIWRSQYNDVILEVADDGVYITADGKNSVPAILYSYENGAYTFITLNDDLSFGTEYTFAPEGSDVIYHGDSDVTLGKSTAIPYSLHGTYASESGEYVLILSHRGIYFNEDFVTDVTEADGKYSFSVEDADYTLSVNADGSIALGGAANATLIACKWADLIGTWRSGSTQGKIYGDCTITITASGLTLTTADGKTYTATNISWYLYTTDSIQSQVISFVAGDEGYQIQTIDMQSLQLWIDDGSAVTYYWLDYNVDVTDDWSEYIGGVFSDGKVSVQFDDNELVVTVNGEPLNITDVKAIASADYFRSSISIAFTFNCGETSYTVTYGLMTGYVIFDDGTSESRLLFADYQADYSEYVGLYVSYYPTNDFIYILNIGEDGSIDLTIGGSEANVEVLSFDAAEGFALKVDGKDMWLMYRYDSNYDEQLYLVDGDRWSLQMNHCRWEEFVGGVFVGEKDGVTYKFTVKADRVIFEMGEQVIELDIIDGINYTRNHNQYDNFNLYVNMTSYNILILNTNKLRYQYYDSTIYQNVSIDLIREGTDGTPPDLGEPDLTPYRGKTYRGTVRLATGQTTVTFSVSADGSKITLSIGDQTVEGTVGFNDYGNLQFRFVFTDDTYTVEPSGTGMQVGNSMTQWFVFLSLS